MKTILNTTSSTMEWRDPTATGSRYELWAGEDLLATLTFGASSRSLANVETAEGRWTLQQAGFLRPSVLIREEDSDLDLAVFHPGFLGRGRLRFTNGVTFHWRHEGLGAAVWDFQGEGGEVLISLGLEATFDPGPEPQRVRARVEVTPAGHFSPRVPLLAALGWYLILLNNEAWVPDPPLEQVY